MEFLFVLIAYRSVKDGVIFLDHHVFVFAYELMFLASVSTLDLLCCALGESGDVVGSLLLTYEAKPQPFFVFPWCLIFQK